MAWFLPIAAAVVGGLASSKANKKQNKSNQKAQDQQNAENERVRLLQNEENRRVAALERQQAEADFSRDRKLAEQDDASRFQRTRDAAVAAGYNPLTALELGGTTGPLSPFVNMPSGVSADGYAAKGYVAKQVFDWGPTVVNALNAAIPEISGQAGVARQREQLEQDLLRAQADSLRMSAVGAVGGGGYSGGRPSGSSSAAFPPIGGTGRTSDIFGDRPHEVMPSADGPGVTRITNAFTGPNGIYVPGADGEPWGIDEVATAAVVGGPQIVYNTVTSAPLMAPSFGEMFRIEPNSPVGRLSESIRSWAQAAAGQAPITVHQPAHSSGRPLMGGAHSSGRP